MRDCLTFFYQKYEFLLQIIVNLKINFSEKHFEFLLKFSGGRHDGVVRMAVSVGLGHDPSHVVSELHRVAVLKSSHSLLDLKTRFLIIKLMLQKIKNLVRCWPLSQNYFSLIFL